jgi:hypothetical protein
LVGNCLEGAQDSKKMITEKADRTGLFFHFERIECFIVDTMSLIDA